MTGIVVIGGGFAGLWAALGAARVRDRQAADFAITLVSREPYLTIRPRLYEAAPETLRVPLDPVLAPVGVGFVAAEVAGIDTEARTVAADGPDGALGYDRLILAAGSVQRDLAVPGAAEHAWNIDTWDAAVALDRHLRRICRDPDADGHDTVVIIGAGFTGIELATEMRARLAVHGGAGTAARARVILIDQAATIGPELGPGPRPVIERALRDAGLETRLETRPTRIEADAVTLADGARIRAATAIVTVGLKASPLAEALAVARDAAGRVAVDPMLRVTGIAGVFAGGDMARAEADDDHLALMSCQHALRTGRVAGHNAARDLLGLALRPYRQPDYVTCLDLGASGAVFTKGWDRAVAMTGAEAKALKRKINREIIYPPEADRGLILAQADPDFRSRR